MGRLGSVGLTALTLSFLAIGLSACGGGSATTIVTDEVPASVSLTPTPTSSMDVGATQLFSASARNENNTVISETFSYRSSNPAVVTVAATGNVCAGTWDSLITPTTCTPGPTGVALITASARGVSSAPTAVYVHQHINSIQISVVPSATNPSGPCYSKDQALDFQASAFSGVGGGLTDITGTVGQFTWQTDTTSVVTLKTLTLNSSNQPVLNQVSATAATPGTSNIFASVSGVNSAPLNFVTCAVQKITLAVPNDGIPSGNASFVVPTGTSTTIDATVIDTLGHTITGVPLTWSSSNRTSVTAAGATSTLFGSVGTATASAVGGAGVIASCTPPTCNIGFSPSLPIYPTGVISFVVTGSGTTAGTYSIFATSKGTGVDASTGPWSCAGTIGCGVRVISITGSSSGTNTAGNASNLPSPPNSMVFEPGGTAAYLGVDSSLLGTRGLIVLTTASGAVALHPTAPGKVLAISPDGKTVILSDTVDVPNQVYIFNTTSNTVVATLNITGATAASFSPDDLKAYILAGNQLYIYSAIDSLENLTLSSPGFVATDVAFLPVGAFAQIAGGPPNTVTAYTTCLKGVATDGSTQQIVGTPGLPSMLRPLPDGSQVLAMDSPGIDYIDVSTAPVGCPPTITTSFAQSVNLGQGNFVPTQFIVSPDGLSAYIVRQNSSTILAFNIANKTTSAITLTGNAIALQASLTPDGKFLYVGAEDVPPPVPPATTPAALGSVHVLDTTQGADVQQIIFQDSPQPFCIGAGTPTPPPPAPVGYCYPDFVAVKP
jgi:hypothetical protein